MFLRRVVIFTFAIAVINLTEAKSSIRKMDNEFTPEEIKMLVAYNYAEAANQPPEVWVANTYAALNRLKAGKYGKSLEDVLSKMSSAIRNNSPQWQLATGQKKRNAYENQVYNKIGETVDDVVSGRAENPIGKAAYFENIEKFGIPSWAKKMKQTAKVGAHTYFSE